MFKILATASIIVLGVELLTGGPPISDSPAELPPAGEVVAESPEGVVLDPRLLVSGLESPVDIVGEIDGDRLFVVEKGGRIRIVDGDEILSEPFLDLQDWVLSRGNEQGMLSMRFHPNFAENGRVFVFFTDQVGTSQLVEARVLPENRDRVDPSSLQSVLSIPQYGQYHQSGSMFFGPDGHLWLSLGDGGGIGDPEGNGQNPGVIEASILRIDVDGPGRYSVPSDNPFVGEAGGRGEVWAYGLRNPWRISYDAVTGLLYIPDVGQEGVEELNVIPISEGGHNFGWSVTEGNDCYDADTCSRDGQTMPVYQYLHDGNGCAIVGGQVYRGSLMPEMAGHYFFADFCLGWIRSVVLDDESVRVVYDWTKTKDDRLGNVTTFGSDRHGELYVGTLEGEIWRLETAPAQ